MNVWGLACVSRAACFPSSRLQAEDITKAVQDDADAILVLDQSLVPASQAWPRAYAFTSQPPVRAAAACSCGRVARGCLLGRWLVVLM